MPPRDPVIPATPPNSEISPQDNTSRTYPANVSDVLATQNKSTISIVLTATGDRSTFKFGSDDYNTETLRIAQAYAVGTTSEAKNKYGIDSQLTEGAILGSVITDNNGNPVGISDEAPGSPPAGPVAFINRATAGTIGKSLFVNLSDSGQLDINIIKGKATAANINSRDYDVLLGEINRDNTVQSYGTENDNELPASVIRTVTLQNSNSPNNLYVPDGQGIPEKQSNVGRIVLPIKLGSYSKIQPTIANGGSQTGNVSAEGNFLANQDLVQSLGSQVTLKSSGEYYVPKNAFNTDEVLLARAATLAPGRARLGIKVPFEEMRASTVLKQNNPNFADFDLPTLKQDEVLSYGSYNNWLNAFNNGNTIASIPGLAIQIGTLGLLLVGIAALVKPNDEYLDDFKVGFVTFFGLPPLPTDGGGITGSAAFAASVAQAIFSNRLQKETGWYSTILRSINRIIVESTVGTGLTIAANAGDDVYGASAAGVQGAQNVIDQFYKGRLRGFINDLAIIGKATVNYSDISIQPYERQVSLGSDSALTPNGPSYIDAYPDMRPKLQSEDGRLPEINLASLIRKNRLTQGFGFGLSTPDATPLAWATTTTPSKYILPRNILTTAGLTSDNGRAAMQTLTEIGAITGSLPRLSPTDVANLEATLETSYMPFYFHDLRTNEIVSFHAFLEDTQDNFSADWNAQTPYGRVEPIHTYKGTTRDISLSFYVVATSPQDHHNMWWKINKLVTMVYPQYTAGRQVNLPDGQKFIQPFSQIPGGSPIIRLRLGDLWKSNYNKFNVARAFGLSQGNSAFRLNINNQTGPAGQAGQPDDTAVNTAIQNNISAINARINSGRLQQGDEFTLNLPTLGRRSLVIGNSSSDSMRSPGRGYLEVPRAVRNAFSNRSVKFKVKAVNISPEQNDLVCEYVVDWQTRGQTGPNAIYRCPNPNIPSREWAAAALSGITSVFAGSSGAEARLVAELNSRAIEIRERYEEALRPVPDSNYVARKATEMANSAAPTAAPTATPTPQDQAASSRAAAREAILGFFGEQNPIMQAFESTAGKGMAVAFKSINFDWKNSTWETGATWDAEGHNSSRAPMFLKISMAGTVIHDITPGIDFAGLNTSPVYQVGNYSNVFNKAYASDVGEDEARSATSSEATAVAVPSTSPIPSIPGAGQ